MINTLFDLKIKELEILNKEFEVKDDILIIYDKHPIILGCKHCYMVKPISTKNGYEIDKGKLINYYEKFKDECTLPKQIAINCWLCPVCFRLFKELLPKYIYCEVKNVSL